MISKLAFVHPDAKIGKDVNIDPFAYVAANVEIGDGTWVGPNSTILDGARIAGSFLLQSYQVFHRILSSEARNRLLKLAITQLSERELQ
jgi:UDP-3-O-[3-hydroxymyristoyl] glucosamine N-acyltransferase